MKKKLFTLLLGALAAAGAGATTTWNLNGTDYLVDSLFYNQVGPGTTTTSLWFHTPSGNSLLRVFYTTMDMTNPYLSLRGVCAKDMLAGNETISGMAQRHSQPGQRYFIGVNGDFFYTRGATARGVSTVGTPVGSTVVDGQIFRARNNTREFKNFVVDTAGQVYVNPFWFGGTVVAANGSSASLGGINIPAGEVNNGITIYNDRYYGSTNESGNGTEVLARLASGNRFETASAFKLVLSADPVAANDMTIPDSTYVLHGHGTAASFLNGLHQGDTLTVTPTWSFNGHKVAPEQIVSGNPKILADGVTLDSEADRGDASSNQPRAAIGYSDGGKRVYFFVVDGRSARSFGVRTKVLADIMRYAGVTDAMNVDGGGSAVLYTLPLGIRNTPSDGIERADGNGFYCVSSAPDDSTIAALRFIDFKLQTPHYGMYSPHFYGYNKYGMLIDQDVQGVTLSCDKALGTVLNDTTFYADGTLTQGLLTGSLGNVSVSMPMSVVGTVEAISITCDSVVNDGYHPYAIDVNSTVGGQEMPINPAALTWRSTNEDVVTVGDTTGVLLGVATGEAQVIGTIGDVSDTLRVIVEKPTARVMAVDPDFGLTSWKLSQTGGKNGKAEADGNGGFTYTYTGASGRAPKLTLTKALRLWSLPDTLRLRLNPGEAPVKNVVLGMRSASHGTSYQTLTPTITPNQEVVIDLPTAAWIDTTDISNYPLSLNSIQINMNAAKSGQQYVMRFLGLETVYAAVPAASKQGDLDGDGKVNTTDITLLVDAILAGSTAASYDIDGNGQVNTADVTALVTLVLKN